MTNHNNDQPAKGYFLVGFIALCVLLVLWMFAGCVSIKTHEIAKLESFEAGACKMAERVLNSVDNYESIEEMKYDLKGIVDAYELRSHRSGVYK